MKQVHGLRNAFLISACFSCLFTHQLTTAAAQTATPPAVQQEGTRKEKALGLLLQAQEIIRFETSPFGRAAGLLAIGDVYAKLGEKDRAELLLTESSHAMDLVDQLPDGLSKNIFLIPLARAYVTNGNKLRAEEILDAINYRAKQVGRPEYQAQVLPALVPVYMSLGRNDKAGELLSSAHERVLTMDAGFYRNHGLAQLAIGYAILGERERAFQMVEMGDASSERDWSDVAIALAESGDLAGSLIACRKIKPSMFVAESFGAVAVRYIALGQKEMAVAVLAEMTATMVKNRKATGTIFDNSAVWWALVGHYDKALTLVNRIEAHTPKLRALTKLIPIFAKAGRHQQNEQLLSKASKLIKSSKGGYSDGRDLALVGSAYAQAGKTEEALKLLMRAATALKGYEKEPIHDMVLRDIALTYAEMQRDDQALETTQKINDLSQKTEALVVLAGFWLGLKADQKGPPIG